MANDVFRFKQFALEQGGAPFRLGTDAVLLGAWAALAEGGGPILDVGTGTGILALMAAQRCLHRQVWALENEPNALEQAAINVNSSPWSARISLFQASLLSWEPPQRVDDLLVNPPYFLNHTPNPDERKNQARHASHDLPLRWATRFAGFLSEKGKVHLVVPEVSFRWWEAALGQHFELHRHTRIQTTEAKPVGRHLMSWQKSPVKVQRDQQVLYHGTNRSAWYAALCRDFYLD